MKNIGLLIIGVAIIAASAVGFVVGSDLNSTYKKRVEDQARYECALVFRIEIQESDTIQGIYVADEPYKKCLKEKGL